MTFVQSLTEAVKSVPNALLVVSLPASDVVRDMPGADGPVWAQAHRVASGP